MHIINRESKCAIPLTFKCHEDILLLDKCVLCYRKCVKTFFIETLAAKFTTLLPHCPPPPPSTCFFFYLIPISGTDKTNKFGIRKK